MRVPFSSSTQPGTGRVKRPGRRWSSSDSFSGTLSMKSRTFPFFSFFPILILGPLYFLICLHPTKQDYLFCLKRRSSPSLYLNCFGGFYLFIVDKWKKLSLKKKNLIYFSNWLTQYLIIWMVKCMLCSESDVLIAAVNCWYPTSDCAKEHST